MQFKNITEINLTKICEHEEILMLKKQWVFTFKGVSDLVFELIYAILVFWYLILLNVLHEITKCTLNYLIKPDKSIKWPLKKKPEYLNDIYYTKSVLTEDITPSI